MFFSGAVSSMLYLAVLSDGAVTDACMLCKSSTIKLLSSPAWCYTGKPLGEGEKGTVPDAEAIYMTAI